MRGSSKIKEAIKRFWSGIANARVFRALKQAKQAGEDIHQVKSNKEIIKKIERKQQETVAQAFARTEALEARIMTIEKSDQTTFRRLGKLHRKLNAKFELYRRWHQNPHANALNIAALIVFAFTTLFTSWFMYGPMYQKALADAQTCTWDGSDSTDWENGANWANLNACNGVSTVPGPTNNIAFANNSPTYDLILTSNKTVTAVTSTVAGFAKTFNTNGYSLTVNGDLTWTV